MKCIYDMYIFPPIVYSLATSYLYLYVCMYVPSFILSQVKCAMAFFGDGIKFTVLKGMPVSKLMKFPHRTNDETGNLQLQTTPILDHLSSIKKADAYVIMGFTNIDLYPNDDWNFVFGQADSSKGSGIFSFCRYV